MMARTGYPNGGGHAANKRWRAKNPVAAKISRNQCRKANYKEGRVDNTRARLPWTIAEGHFIYDSENRAKGDRWISKVIGRSVQAIQIHRTRINPPDGNGDGGESNNNPPPAPPAPRIPDSGSGRGGFRIPRGSGRY
jgi:hypothetical protein